MKKRKNSHSGSRARALAVGALVHGLLFVIAMLIGSAIIFLQSDPTSVLDIGALIAFISGGALSGFLVSKKHAEGGLALSSASALIFTLVLVIISIIASGGKVAPRALMNYACYLPTAVLFAFIAARKPKPKRRRRR